MSKFDETDLALCTNALTKEKEVSLMFLLETWFIN